MRAGLPPQQPHRLACSPAQCHGRRRRQLAALLLLARLLPAALARAAAASGILNAVDYMTGAAPYVCPCCTSEDSDGEDGPELGDPGSPCGGGDGGPGPGAPPPAQPQLTPAWLAAAAAAAAAGGGSYECGGQRPGTNCCDYCATLPAGAAAEVAASEVLEAGPSSRRGSCSCLCPGSSASLDAAADKAGASAAPSPRGPGGAAAQGRGAACCSSAAAAGGAYAPPPPGKLAGAGAAAPALTLHLSPSEERLEQLDTDGLDWSSKAASARVVQPVSGRWACWKGAVAGRLRPVGRLRWAACHPPRASTGQRHVRTAAGRARCAHPRPGPTYLVRQKRAS